jgi:hypothetical protein
MFKQVLIIIGVLVCVLSVTLAGAQVTNVMGKHSAKGLNCAVCHQENPPAKAVPSSKCESCHGDNEAMSKVTVSDDPNPHYNHVGNVPCTECHKNHSDSVLMCNECHAFRLVTP